MQMEPCWFMRLLNKNNCVVQLESTGAILHIETSKDLDMSKASMVSPMNPAQGMVGLGPYVDFKFTECVLHMNWNEPSYPLPNRPKKKTRNMK